MDTKNTTEDRDGMWKGNSDHSHNAPRRLAQIKKEVHIMSTNELESKVRKLRQLQALIDEAEQEAEAIKDAIKAFMGDSEELRAGEYSITWRTVKSARIDTSALKKALPDVAQAFTREAAIRRFCVT